jgi:pilus assembly protein CpaC
MKPRHSHDKTAEQGIAKMLKPMLSRILFAGLALAATVGFAPTPTFADSGLTVSYGSQGTNRSVKVGLNKSVVIDLPRDARDILVSNPVIADAVIRTPRRIYVTGVAVGQSNVIVFDRAGQQIVSLDLEVERDASTLATMLRRLIPDSDIGVEIVSDNIVLSGFVKNAGDSRRAQDLAVAFANGGQQSGVSSSNGGQAAMSQVVNMLTIQGEDQVQLKITVAEVNRNLAKNLGVDWDIQNISVGSIGLGALTNLTSLIKGEDGKITVPTTTNGAGFSTPVGGGTLGAAVSASQSTGLIKVLAEPTLTAISGESASFLAGGSFPVPLSDGNGNTSITFKDYGVALAMTPIVLSDGRISLRMKTEVSQLSPENSIGDVPSLTVRRAETTLELPSGGSMVLGGLLQDTARHTINSIPGLGKLPILGALFRSRDFQRAETELVIIATPYLVKPVARDQLATPDQGFAVPTDAQSTLLGRINKVYGGGATGTTGKQYQGRVGYIYE